MAVLATGNDHDAQDIVQDAMLAFVRRYTSRPEEEWTPLFYRVMQNQITDWYRRSSIRNRLRVWFSWGLGEDEQAENPLEQLPDVSGKAPDSMLLGDEFSALLEKALRELTFRQRQAFLLRAWQGLDTQDTAIAMGCSQGSVKTHYFRAIHALRESLEEYGS